MDTIVSGGHSILQEISSVIGGAVYGKILGTVAIAMLAGIYRHIKNQIDEVMHKVTYTLCYLRSVDKANEIVRGELGKEYSAIREQELARLLREEGFITPK